MASEAATYDPQLLHGAEGVPKVVSNNLGRHAPSAAKCLGSFSLRICPRSVAKKLGAPAI